MDVDGDVEITTKLGIGTDAPAARLEIVDPGVAAFRLNVDGGSTWAISNTGTNVTFNRLGSGGQETTFRDRLDGSGLPTFSVQGSVEGTQFINSSSRALKTGFSGVDPTDVLAAVGALPVRAWRYRWEPEGSRHIGPVAEDFQRAFSLGDGEHISTVDAQGVTLAAIQGLYELVQKQETVIEELQTRVRKLENQGPGSQ